MEQCSRETPRRPDAPAILRSGQATYQFDDEAALDRALKEEVPQLIAKFVRDRPDALRIRETIVLAQEFGA